jgi:hypothetical protein
MPMSSAELARLDQLIPDARPWFEALIRAMNDRGWDPFIGQVLRTPAQQQAAIAAGTTSKHQTLSWHFLGRAVDFRRRLDDGTEDMTTGGDDAFWQALYQEATKIVGMRSLAYHPNGTKMLLNGTLWDCGHVEWRLPWAELSEAVSAEAPELLA